MLELSRFLQSYMSIVVHPFHREFFPHNRPEPRNLTLINENPEVISSFEQFGCMEFCTKIQGFNIRLAEQFALSFDGSRVVISGVIF
jgi:hypothetical protein